MVRAQDSYPCGRGFNSHPWYFFMSKFQGKKIVVLGKGVEGESSAKFLEEKGAQVSVLDENDNLENLDSFDLIVRSPGVRIDDIRKSQFARRQATSDKRQPDITSQTKLFFDLCPCPIIGVTGTKGKGTTASLIYEMLKKEGKDAYLGGNIGVPPLTFLDKLKKNSIVVLELSSFQLIDIGKSPSDAKAMEGKPHIAVILMTTSEHLDWHKDVLEYVQAKRNILRFQTESDLAVINKDYPVSRESDVLTNGQVFYISRVDEVVEGCFIKDEKVIVRQGGIEQEIIDIKEILLPGRHNLENVCAATMAAILAGVNRKNISQILATFKGLEHRLELVSELRGIKYYDDSFSTTPETAIAAIEAFEAPEILILGGSSKKSDFKELGKVIAERANIKAIIGIGVEWERIKESIPGLAKRSGAGKNQNLRT